MTVASRVADIINTHGETATYKRAGSGSFNSTTLQNSVTYTDYTITVHARKYRADEVSGLIHQGDREIRTPKESLTFTPRKDDRLVLSTGTFNIVSVDTRTGYGQDLLHILTVRGGVV